MNKQAEQSIQVKALDPKTEVAAKKDPGPSPEMSSRGGHRHPGRHCQAQHKSFSNLRRTAQERRRLSGDGSPNRRLHVSRVFPEGRCRPGINNQAAMRALGRFGAALAANGNPHAVQILRSSRSSSRRSKTSDSGTNSGRKIHSLITRSNGTCCGRGFFCRPFTPSKASIRTPSTRQNSTRASSSVHCHPPTLS